MRPWVAAAGLYFLSVAACAAVLPRLPPARRTRAAAASAAGLGLSAGAHLLPWQAVLHGWILPPSLLLLAYWTSGLLFVAPMPRAERALLRVDRALGVHRLAAATPRWLAEVLELGYVSIYPLVPAALAIHQFAGPRADADRFWTVVLITDLVCFAFLPWVQTRPPRALLAGDPWRARARRLNLRLIGASSIQVNTCPSGHAAEALAVTLLVWQAPPPLAAAVAFAGLLVTLGSVLGRYHYAADALAGWAVAAAVWWLAG